MRRTLTPPFFSPPFPFPLFPTPNEQKPLTQRINMAQNMSDPPSLPRKKAPPHAPPAKISFRQSGGHESKELSASGAESRCQTAFAASRSQASQLPSSSLFFFFLFFGGGEGGARRIERPASLPALGGTERERESCVGVGGNGNDRTG